MGIEYGGDWRAKCGATPSAIGGEGSLDWEQTAKEIDRTTKDDAGYTNSAAGPISITFTMSGKLKLPDTGFEAMHDAFVARTPIDWEVVNGAIIKFHGAVTVTSLKITAPTDDDITFSATLKNAGAPTVNDLGASA